MQRNGMPEATDGQLAPRRPWVGRQWNRCPTRVESPREALKATKTGGHCGSSGLHSKIGWGYRPAAVLEERASHGDRMGLS